MTMFTDDAGADWELIDFKTVPPGDRKRRCGLGAPDATGRAFYRADEVRIYWFGLVAYRDQSSRTLREQFRNARPTTQAVARQHWDRANDAGA